MRDHPPGVIGILSGDLARYTAFTQSLLGLMAHVPPGTHGTWVQSQWVARAVNLVIAQMRPEDEWCMIWADDHTFDPDILMRLLDHDVPLVAPLCPLRIPPFGPSLFHATEGGFVSYTLAELAGKTGLLAVDTFGGPGCVIRREVIEALGRPFFQNGTADVEVPQEDLTTFNRCRLAGFQPYVDLDCVIGHCVMAVLLPERNPEGEYGTAVQIGHQTVGVLYPQQAMNGQGYHTYT